MNQPAEFDRVANLKAILDVRHEAPELKGSWQIHYLTPIPTEIPGISTIASEHEWLKGADLRIPLNVRTAVLGHGSVEVTSCYGTDPDRHCFVIFRGGLAVAYLVEQRSRPGVDGSVFAPRDQTRHVTHAHVSWIEPGVPDQARRQRKHEERMRRHASQYCMTCSRRLMDGECAFCADAAEARSLEQGRQEEIWEAGQQANYDRQTAEDNERWDRRED